MPTIETPDMGLVSVRAKFIVTKVEFYSASSRRIVMKPVYSEDPNHENKQFWDATPSGELTMVIQNPRAAEFFTPGQEYYIDFTHPSKMASFSVRNEVHTGSSSSNAITLPSVTTP
jgi:hypothetical protein